MYNMETDGGATDHVLTQARWDAAVGSGNKHIYFPGSNWTCTAKNLQLQDGITIEGDGLDITIMTLTASIGANEFWFQSIGHSYITVKDIGFTSAAKKYTAVFQLNSMGASSSTICRDIAFINVGFKNIYADCIRGGDKGSASETHHIINLVVKGCRVSNIGNPVAKWIFDDNAPNSVTNNFINGGQTLWSCDVENNYVQDVYGAFFYSNSTGWQDSTGFIPNAENGNYVVKNNTAISCYIFLTWLGNLLNGPIVIGNHWINPTMNVGLCHTINARYAIIKDNINDVYCGRMGGEIRVVDSEYGDKINIHLRDATEYPGTSRQTKTAVTYAVLAAGSNNWFHPTINHDRSGTKYTNAPDIYRGIFIVGFDDVANKPALIDGVSYSHNWNFDGLKVFNGSGKVIYNEISGLPVSNIQLPASVTVKTAYQTESVFELYNNTGDYGGYADGCNINLIGSPAATAGKGLISVNRNLQGNTKTKFINLGMKVALNSKWTYVDGDLYETLTAKQYIRSVSLSSQ